MTDSTQRSFAGGEIAPVLYGRADQTKYATGLRTCRNFQIDRQGGASNRQGSQYVSLGLLTSTHRSKLLKFVFNARQAYVIEFRESYMRWYRQADHLLVDGPSVLGWDVLTNYVVGDLVSAAGPGNIYYCILGHIGHMPPNGTYWHALTGLIYEIPHPYLYEDLAGLKGDQTGDVLTITHQNHPPMELKRYGDTRWILTTVVTAPGIAAPVGLAVTKGAGGALKRSYQVTAVMAETYEESLPSGADDDTGAAPTAAAPFTAAWTATATATEYNVYCDADGNGAYGFVGVAATNAFSDPGIIPDYTNTPPVARSLFAGTGEYPKVSTVYQQRKIYANTLLKPETGYASRSGFFKNFTSSSPIQDDDAITFQVPGRTVSGIQHLVELGKLIALTESEEQSIEGDADGILAPGAVNPKRQGYRGASDVAPALVGDSIIYVQSRGNMLRDLRFEFQQDGYTGNDLTIFASHLFKGRTITALDYADIPDSIVWAIRDDGVLLGLTYIREQQIFAWHRHDTDGRYQDLCIIPEDGEDYVYVSVLRPGADGVGGITDFGIIERFPARFIQDQVTDCKFLDSYFFYDGRNTDPTNTMIATAVLPWSGATAYIAGDVITRAGNTYQCILGHTNHVPPNATYWTRIGAKGAGWTPDDTLKLVANSDAFTIVDVGNRIEIRVGVDKVRLQITALGAPDATIVYVRPEANVPAALQSVATADWTKCVDTLLFPDFGGGAYYFNGKTVSVYADGNVLPQEVVAVETVATPSGNVTTGVIHLERCYGYIAVGLPIVAELETLDIDNPSSDVRGRQKRAGSAMVLVEKSRGFLIGSDGDNLAEYKPEMPEGYGDVPPLVTDLVDLGIYASWEPNGRVVIRQTDPLPVSVLALITNSDIGG